MNENPSTSASTVNAPADSMPRNLRLTPRGVSSAPLARRFPEVRGGQCEHCGTIDPYQPGQYQYKLCPHYRGMELKCAYCPLERDQDEVIRNSTLKVFEHPYHPGELMTLCGRFDCIKKFEKEFNINPATV